MQSCNSPWTSAARSASATALKFFSSPTSASGCSAKRGRVQIEDVALVDWVLCGCRNIEDGSNDRIYHGRAIPDRSFPGRRMIAPLEQFVAGPPESANRPFFVLLLPPPADLPGLAQRSLDAFAWRVERRFNPGAEHFVEQPVALRLRQNLECRIDFRFDRPLAKQLGAEAMNRADVRFFEIHHRRIEPLGFFTPRHGDDTMFLELFTQAEFQLAGRLLAEGHRDNLRDRGPAARDERHDASHELRRLAGARCRLDDQRVVQSRRDELAIVSGNRHGILRSASRSANSAPTLRRVRCSSREPQTAVKSQRAQAPSEGRAASNPFSIARSTTSSTSMARRRLSSSSAIGCTAKAPTEVQNDKRPSSTVSPVRLSSAMPYSSGWSTRPPSTMVDIFVRFLPVL